MTNEPDLDQPATVLWVDEIPPSTPSEAGKQRNFETLSEAVRFVTQLPDRQRATALIDSQGKSYEVSEDGELVEKV